MPRKSKFERLVSGIARTRKQTTKLANRVPAHAEALASVDRRLEDLQRQTADANGDDAEAIAMLNGEFKDIKRTLRAIKIECKPVLAAMKAERRAAKEARRAEKQAMKAERQAAKQAKKEERERKKLLLEEARMSALPQQATRCVVDGWNVMGALLKGRGRSKGKMISFLQEFAATGMVAENQYTVSVIFDGRGRDEMHGAVFVRYSGSEIADDVLVNEYDTLVQRGVNCSDAMVVTSDRELTLRLHALGVQVMKSGTFVRLVKELLAPVVDEDGDSKMDDGDAEVVVLEEDDWESSSSESSDEE